MENLTNEQQQYDRAMRRVKAVGGFYRHLAVYVLVNAFLIARKYFTRDHDDVFLEFSTFSTAFFWGIGLAFHGFGVFWTNVFFGRNWEERKVRELMEKDKKQKWE